MPNDFELINIQVRALFTHDAKSKIVSVNEPSGAPAPAPRLFLGRTRAGSIWRFRDDLPERLCGELNRLCADEPPPSAEFNEPPRHLETYVWLLEKHAPVREISSGPAYQFTEKARQSKAVLLVTEENAEILHGGFEEFVDELAAWQPFVAFVEENQAVSICRSVRITSEAHEAGVETLPNFRGRGLAKEATAEWARLVQTAGAIPLYSTAWENKASQAVARKLRLECYGVDFQIA